MNSNVIKIFYVLISLCMSTCAYANCTQVTALKAIEALGYKQVDGESLIACKVMPNNRGKTIVAYADSKALVTFVINNQSGNVINKVVDESPQYTSLRGPLEKVEVDTAKYTVAANKRAFGVRVTYRQPRQYITDLSLLLVDGSQLKIILKDLTVSAQFDAFDGTQNSIKTTIAIAQSGLSGFYNLHLTETELSWGEETTRRKVMTYQVDKGLYSSLQEVEELMRMELNNDELVDSFGVINGEQYAVTIRNGHYLVLGKLTSKADYEPIAIASLGYLPYPKVEIKNNAVVVNAGYGHHGTYDYEYTFNLKDDKFYLSKYLSQASYGEDYHDPSVQLIDVVDADFDKSVIRNWKLRFVIYKGSESGELEETKGIKTWGIYMDKMRSRSLPIEESKVRKIKPEKTYLLDNFNFDVFSPIDLVNSK